LGGDLIYKNFMVLDLVFPWPAEADGGGYLLQLIAPESCPDPTVPGSWRAGITWASWSAARGGIAHPLEDAEGDGLSALMEYALGSAALVPSPEADPQGRVADGQFTLTFRKQPGATDLRYAVEFSRDLNAWTEGGVLISTVSNADGTVTEIWRRSAPATSRSQFARLRVTLNP
jgi:hypothetical protein